MNGDKFVQLTEPELHSQCACPHPGFVLEGVAPWELPECLIGALRLEKLEVKTAKPLNMDKEIPLL